MPDFSESEREVNKNILHDTNNTSARSSHRCQRILSSCSTVILDLETSGLRKDCEILQIALVDLNDDTKVWSKYIHPTQPIDSGATMVNHLSIIQNRLCYRGEEVQGVVSAPEAINLLNIYLRTNYPDGVTLVAHNGIRLDFPRLCRYFEKYRGDSNTSIFPIKCVDTINVFKKHFPEEGQYNQPYLVKRFSYGTQMKDAHEGVGDCMNLKMVLRNAAKDKKMSVEQFLGELLPSGHLCVDCRVKEN